MTKLNNNMHVTKDGFFKRNPPSSWTKKEYSTEEYNYLKGDYDISVLLGNTQGLPGSNMVSVIGGKWGGYLLDTPKKFRTIQEVSAFVEYAKKELDAGREGKKVPFVL